MTEKKKFSKYTRAQKASYYHRKCGAKRTAMKMSLIALIKDLVVRTEVLEARCNVIDRQKARRISQRSKWDGSPTGPPQMMTSEDTSQLGSPLPGKPGGGEVSSEVISGPSGDALMAHLANSVLNGYHQTIETDRGLVCLTCDEMVREEES